MADVNFFDNPSPQPAMPARPRLNLAHPPQVRLAGLLGQALEASRRNHLRRFIRDETSPPIALFCPEHVQHNEEGDWYGEHAGKWLYAAARAAMRTGDADLTGCVRRVADYLVGRQSPDGYLGVYAPARRFMCKRARGPLTWDGAPAKRTWDIWVHAYLVLGLIEAGRLLASPTCLAAARRIGDLCHAVLAHGDIDITELGNHHGLSATILLDPAMELHFATGEEKYLELARLILRQADAHPPLALLTQALAGADAAFIATGKAYQLCWNLVGLAKLFRATADPRHLTAATQLWENIRGHHLTLGGGPWGGVAHRSREVFNPPNVFSPSGYVETCSILAWIQLNRELLALTGEAKYAEEIEVSAYNDLLGAQAPNGDNWCYYSFPNGRRVHTTYWRCCKSSGPMALEELPALAYGTTGKGDIAVNLYGPGEATLSTRSAGRVRLEQITRYPFAGDIRIMVEPERAAAWSLLVRVPAWAAGATIEVNGTRTDAAPAPGSYAVLQRTWRPGDTVALLFSMPPRWHDRSNRNVQESRAPDGSPVSQEILRQDFAAISRGPLVYATDLIDGFKTEETIRLPADRTGTLELLAAPSDNEACPIRLNLGYREPLTFVPYYTAGGREDGAWRLTWLPLAPR